MDKQAVTEALGNMSVGAATSVGFINFIENHSSFMSLSISFMGVIAAIIFYALNYRMRKKEYDLKMQERDKKARRRKVKSDNVIAR